jgi:hypothetical protein
MQQYRLLTLQTALFFLGKKCKQRLLPQLLFALMWVHCQVDCHKVAGVGVYLKARVAHYASSSGPLHVSHLQAFGVAHLVGWVLLCFMPATCVM